VVFWYVAINIWEEPDVSSSFVLWKWVQQVSPKCW
jgi:hypothetical protein